MLINIFTFMKLTFKYEIYAIAFSSEHTRKLHDF